MLKSLALCVETFGKIGKLSYIAQGDVGMILGEYVFISG